MSLRADQLQVANSVIANEAITKDQWISYVYDGGSSETRAVLAIANNSARLGVIGIARQDFSIGESVKAHSFGEYIYSSNVFTSGDVGKSVYLDVISGTHTLDPSTLPRDGSTYLVTLGQVLAVNKIFVDIGEVIGPLIAGSNDMSVMLDHTTGNLKTATVSGGSGSGVEFRLSKTIGIDGLTLAQTPLFTAVGDDYVITKVLVRLSAITGFGGEGSASIGIVGPDYSEIYDETKLEGLETTARVFTFTSLLGSQSLLLDTQTVVFDLDIIYTATSATLEVDLFGYII